MSDQLSVWLSDLGPSQVGVLMSESYTWRLQSLPLARKVREFTGFAEAGTVNVEWDASGQASGIYFYKARAGVFSQTRKMMLLK